MKAFTAAAIQVAPLPGPLTPETVKGNLAKAGEWVEGCVDATGAELVVLPESVTTGFTPGLGPDELWDLVSTVPGPVTEPVQEVARRLGVDRKSVVEGGGGGVGGRRRSANDTSQW